MIRLVWIVRIDPAQAAFPVANQHTPGGWRIALLQRRDQFSVVCNGGATVGAAPEGAFDTPHLIFQFSQRVDEFLVAALLDEGAMNGSIGGERSGRVTGFQRRRQIIVGAAHRRQRRVVHARQRQANRQLFECRNYRIDLTRLLQRNGTDLGAAVGGRHGQSVVFQPLQRLADGRAAHPQRLRQRLIAQWLARGERTIKNPIAQAIIRLIAQADARNSNRFRHWHNSTSKSCEMNTVYNIRKQDMQMQGMRETKKSGASLVLRRREIAIITTWCSAYRKRRAPRGQCQWRRRRRWIR